MLRERSTAGLSATGWLSPSVCNTDATRTELGNNFNDLYETVGLEIRCSWGSVELAYRAISQWIYEGGLRSCLDRIPRRVSPYATELTNFSSASVSEAPEF
jgi:hypothetical protein